MEEIFGNEVYQEGDEADIFDPRIGKKVHVKAVKPFRDGDFCYRCYFDSYCHSCKGISEIGFKCYTTIFEKVEEKK